MFTYLNNMLTLYTGLRADNSGVTAIEYGLIAGLIAVAIVAVITTVGGDLTAVFTKVSTKLQSASSTI